MKKIAVVGAHTLTFFFLLLSSDTLTRISGYTPSSPKKKNNGNRSSSNKGFGKKPLKDGTKNRNAPVAAATTEPEQRYLKPYALELKDNEEFLGDRSVRTLNDRSPGDILLEIPLEDTLTVDRIRSRLAAAAASCARFHDSEELDLDEEEALALGLLQLRDHDDDDANSYISSVLPKQHFNVWTLPGDLWKETSTVLPRCYAETFDATRQRVNKFATQITESAAAGTASTNSNSKDDVLTITLDDALWAFSMVRSRSLAVPELDDKGNAGDRMPLALIPGLDLLNHAFGSGTQLQLVVGDDDHNKKNGEESNNSKWVLTSSDSIQAGDEVFLSYGDDKDNWKLLLTYGFAVPNNPNGVVFWSWRDLLDAAHEVRPDTFTDAICRQLMRHPQLEAYTVKSEQRATFSLDAQTNTPRESLTNGLIMLNSLAAQLGKPEPESDALGNQVLEELRRRRLEELKDGQNRLNHQQAERDNQAKHETNYSEWKPFFESLRIALESEERQLQALG